MLEKTTRLTTYSYYESNVTRPPPCPSLTENHQADVCIIGAGYTGLSTALELRRKGFSVIVLEARCVGWGASGRNGGQALAGYADETAIEKQLSKDAAQRVWQLTIDGLHLLQERIEHYDIDCDFKQGHLYVAVSARKGKQLAQWANYVATRYHHPVQPIAPNEIAHWVASPRYHSGVFDSHEGHLDPLKYCLGLAKAACQEGARLFEFSPVLQIDPCIGNQKQTVHVHTALATVHCQTVVLAGNVYLHENRLIPNISHRIVPMLTTMIATEPLPNTVADGLIKHRAAVSNNNFALDYFRLTPDHRLIFGGGADYCTAFGFNVAVVRHRMIKRLYKIFPQLAPLSAPYAWGGFVDITMNRAPDFRRVAHNMYYLQGFSGHGLVLSGIAGKLVAESIARQASGFDLLSRIQHRSFPGGRWCQTPLLILGTWYHQIMDLI